MRKGYLEIVTKKSHSDKGVVFKAIKTGTNEILSINGKDDVFMSPTRTKGKPIELVLRTKGNFEIYHLYALVSWLIVNILCLFIENKIQDEKLKPETSKCVILICFSVHQGPVFLSPLSLNSGQIKFKPHYYLSC